MVNAHRITSRLRLLLWTLLWSEDSRLDRWLRLVPWYRRRQTRARNAAMNDGFY